MMSRYLVAFHTGQHYREVWLGSYFNALVFLDALDFHVKPRAVRMWGRDPQTKRWGLLVNR